MIAGFIMNFLIEDWFVKYPFQITKFIILILLIPFHNFIFVIYIFLTIHFKVGLIFHYAFFQAIKLIHSFFLSIHPPTLFLLTVIQKLYYFNISIFLKINNSQKLITIFYFLISECTLIVY